MVEGIGCGIDQSAMDGKVSKPIAGKLGPQRAKKRRFVVVVEPFFVVHHPLSSHPPTHQHH
jgi:hypothetical protein